METETSYINDDENTNTNTILEDFRDVSSVALHFWTFKTPS